MYAFEYINVHAFAHFIQGCKYTEGIISTSIAVMPMIYVADFDIFTNNL